MAHPQPARQPHSARQGEDAGGRAKVLVACLWALRRGGVRPSAQARTPLRGPITRSSVRSPPSSRRLHSTRFPVRAPVPGARTLRRASGAPRATAGSAHSSKRSAAFSRFAPGSRAPHTEVALSAPPRPVNSYCFSYSHGAAGAGFPRTKGPGTRLAAHPRLVARRAPDPHRAGPPLATSPHKLRQVGLGARP